MKTFTAYYYTLIILRKIIVHVASRGSVFFHYLRDIYKTIRFMQITIVF